MLGWITFSSFENTTTILFYINSYIKFSNASLILWVSNLVMEYLTIRSNFLSVLMYVKLSYTF